MGFDGEAVASKWGKDLAGFTLLAVASACLGLLINQGREHPLPLIYVIKAGQSETVGLPEFRKIVESENAIILDARPALFYRRGHVPGAISLSREQFEKEYPKRKALNDKDRLIAVYCSGADCKDSGMVAAALVKLGHSRVLVFAGGWDAWTGAGLPAEAGP